MRKTCWTIVIGLALGLAAIAPHRPESGAPDVSPDAFTRLPVADPSGPANGRGDADRVSRHTVAGLRPTAIGSLQSASSRGIPSTADPARATANDGRTQRLADLAPDALLAVLEAEVERARAERGLRVDPAILASMRETGRARVVFDLGEATRDDALAARLMGPTDRRDVEALRVFPLIGHGAARVGPDALRELIRDGAAHHIELDVVHRPVLAKRSVSSPSTVVSSTSP